MLGAEFLAVIGNKLRDSPAQTDSVTGLAPAPRDSGT
ncbi:hypothetical protein [Streptomyces sp. KR55]